MQQAEFVFSGFGGQGVMFIGQLLAYAAMDEGLNATWIPSYGPEMRGGTAHCFVVLSDREIGSPMVENPRVAVVFNRPSFDKYAPLVASGGWLVVNASLTSERTVRDDIQTLYVPATEIAEAIGSKNMTNVVLIGALLAANPILPLSAIEHALEAHIPAHRRKLLPLNYEALRQGAEVVEKARQPI